MNVIIIEDEKPAARRLNRMLNEIGLEPTVMLHSVEESLNWLAINQHPDLIFLDIQLSDGLSFEIFDEIEVNSAIIFTTAYDEYALKAFKLNSIDYLLKPIDNDELENAITKFKNLQQKEEVTKLDLSKLKNLLSGEINNYKSRFTVKIGQRLKIISLENIECFYSENKATNIYTVNGRNYLLDSTLEELESKLNPENFFRVNRKFYVNINAINDIVAYTNSRLKLILNTYKNEEIIVSRERVKEFKNWID